MTVSQSSSVILNSRLSRITPALFTSTVGSPSSAATRSTAARTWAPSLTSAPTASARPLAARQRPLVHLVGAVGEAERAGAGPQVRQREVLADAAAAVRLDGPVDHPLRHRRGDDLDRLDLGVCSLVTDRIHQPRGLEHEQPCLLDPHPGLGDPVLDDALLGQGLAECGAADGPAAHELHGTLGRADLPHAVVDAPGTEPGLRYREPGALAGDQVLPWHPDVVEDDLGVAAVRPVGVAEDPHAALDRDPRRVPRHQDHGVAAVTPVADG